MRTGIQAGQELGSRANVEAVERLLLTGLPLMPCSARFLIEARTNIPGVAPYTQVGPPPSITSYKNALQSDLIKAFAQLRLLCYQ